MPFESEELIQLTDEVFALLETIEEVRKSSSEKGKKISRKEGRKLLRAILALSAKITLDLLD